VGPDTSAAVWFLLTR